MLAFLVSFHRDLVTRHRASILFDTVWKNDVWWGNESNVVIQRFRFVRCQPNTIPSGKRLIFQWNISIGRNFKLSILCFVDLVNEGVDDMFEILVEGMVVLSHCVTKHHIFILELPDFVVA